MPVDNTLQPDGEPVASDDTTHVVADENVEAGKGIDVQGPEAPQEERRSPDHRLQ